MTTLLYTHPVCVEHDPGLRHPECPERLKAIEKALGTEAFAALDRRLAPKADISQLELAHAPSYVKAVLNAAPAPDSGIVHLDGDTAMSAASGEAALRAAGAACAAVDAVAAGVARNAFCAVRPPGHHAEHSRAMGFCLFNNVVVGALHARHKCGLQRVAVVDFDVHHGNGTQHSFEDDGDLFFASSHQYPCYPGSGSERERGVGNIVNAPLPPGSASKEFRAAWTRLILPALSNFAPQIILISAGFDAHADDPLAQLTLSEDDFAWVTREILSVAEGCCDGRVVSTLEGGYNLDALGRSVAAHVGALMEG
ncbi:MAG: acetoin utilization protein [Rhodospirillales bacterium RIFCSPLOWO2_12_FULL_58_28]|nr:MAG: acetoin utilization protein [Rhodospirillales bacterium RIFCSPLOWO2_02_FULL_58_16]OHC78585.1 MAG: acetoin utilization protein [Rhodospirillales bacterium RIFCSPLOWO2_12_FULL_58_28]